MHLIRSVIACLLTLAAMVFSSAALAQVVVSIAVAPPLLPVYVQPAIPGSGYIWTPGYWAYADDDDYYWVPGTWVLPPTVGLLWTPGYWGWSNGFYAWNGGYWGPHIGYYGGVNYGYGYVGTGYLGGYWSGGVFAYNRTVNNFGGVVIANTYSKTIINNTNVTRVSFNGGQGGTTAKPTAQELVAAKDQHTPATAMQTQHQNAASTNKALLASVNHGNPAIAATSKAGTFAGQGVVGAKAVTGAGGNAAIDNLGSGAGLKAKTGATKTLSATSGSTTSKTATGKTGNIGSANTLSTNTGSTSLKNTTGAKTGNIGASNKGAANISGRNLGAAKTVHARTPAADKKGKPVGGVQ